MIVLNNDFKTIQIALYFVAEDHPKFASMRYLLPRLMSAQTDSISSRQAMSQTLELLYGAYVRVRTERIANLSVMSLVLTIVDPKIVQDPALFEQSLTLFENILKDHQRFDEAIFKDEIRMLVEYYQTLKDKKRAYASHRFNEGFFKNDHYGYPLTGTLKDLKKLKLLDLKTYYETMLQQDARYLVINGHVDGLDLNMIERRLGPITKIQQPLITSFRGKQDIQEIIEVTDMKQAIVKMGFLLPVYRQDSLFNAAVLADTILGGYPESRLFKIIREQEGLCYDISSAYDHYKGVLMISSGIDLTKVDHALQAIKTIIHDLQHQGILDDELHHAKKYYIHQIKSSLDSQSNLTKRAFIREMFQYEETIDERIEAIKNVTKDDIIKVLSMIDLDTIYILQGGAQ